MNLHSKSKKKIKSKENFASNDLRSWLRLIHFYEVAHKSNKIVVLFALVYSNNCILYFQFYNLK